MPKYTKKDTKYTDDHGSSNEECDECKFWLNHTHQCRVVAGPINPKGWCMKYLNIITGGKPK